MAFIHMLPWQVYVVPNERAANKVIVECKAQGLRAHVERSEGRRRHVRVLPADDQIYSPEQWREEAARRFGEDAMLWAFVCPGCGHVARSRDWKDAGATSGAVAFSCIGRWRKEGRNDWAKGDRPCNYTLGGLITLPTGVVVQAEAEGRRVAVFAFATDDALALLAEAGR